MVVLILSKCPPGLKGDVTKWLLEISTGVYVRKLSARVRDLLWKRVCDYSNSGEAAMVFSARNEQGFSFYVHNTTWKPADFDGLVLIKKPLPPKFERLVQKREGGNKGKKKQPASSTKHRKHIQAVPNDITVSITDGEITSPVDFVAIDLETTGLKSSEDCIIELGAIRYVQKRPVDEYHTLVKIEKSLPDNIVSLTGIGDELLEEQGVSIENAIKGMLDFLRDDVLVGHYIFFDMLFLQKACRRLDIEFKQYQVIDTVSLAKTLCDETVDNYKLETLIKHFGLAERQEHRALPDAKLAAMLYLKLNEKNK